MDICLESVKVLLRGQLRIVHLIIRCLYHHVGHHSDGEQFEVSDGDAQLCRTQEE